MTTEINELFDQLRGDYAKLRDTVEARAVAAAEASYERRHGDLKTVVDRLATASGGHGDALQRRDVAFTLPSLREYRTLETRAQSIGSDPSGGYLVVPESGPFFDRMRPATIVMGADPIVLDMQSDAIELPSLSGSTTVYRVGEAASLTDSDVALAKLRLTARKYAVRTIASSEWLQDANPSARLILAQDHERQLAARLDFDMLEGNGTGIIGLRRIAGVTATSLGANGATPTLDHLADALYRLEANNASKERVVLFMHPRSWQTLAKVKDSQSRYQLQPDPTTEARRSLFGRPVYTSSQITITETVGSSTDCSYIVAADMSRVVVGRRLELGVLYDPFSKSSTDQVVVQSITRWDMNILQTTAVEVLTGVRP